MAELETCVRDDRSQSCQGFQAGQLLQVPMYSVHMLTGTLPKVLWVLGTIDAGKDT